MFINLAFLQKSVELNEPCFATFRVSIEARWSIQKCQIHVNHFTLQWAFKYRTSIGTLNHCKGPARQQDLPWLGREVDEADVTKILTDG